MTGIRHDLAFGARLLRKGPAFAAVAILTMTLAIAACATLVSIIYEGFVLHVDDESRLAAIIASVPERHVFYYRYSVPEFRDIVAGAKGFEDIAGVDPQSVTLNRGDYPELVPSIHVSASIFPMLRTHMLLGRTFLPEEDRLGGPRVAVIDGTLWKSKFAADPSIIGREILLDNQKTTVVGVVPDNFGFWGASIYLPLQLDLADTDRTNRRVWAVGNVRDDSSLAATAASLKDLPERWQAEFGGAIPDYAGMRLTVRNVPEWVHASIRPSIIVLAVATGLVLLVAAVNLANLLLARATTRKREVAVRCALGATRWRITQQLLTENVSLAAIGAALGLLLANWCVPVAGAMIPYDLLSTPGGNWRLEWPAIAISLLAAAAIGILPAVLPAMRLSRIDVNSSLKESSARTMGERSARSSRSILTIAETSVAIVLMAGAALLVQSYRSLMHADLGFQPGRMISMGLALPQTKYPAVQDVAAFYKRFFPALAAIPGADGAAITTGRPMADRMVDLHFADFTIEGRPVPDAKAIPAAAASVVSRNYFNLMGTRVIAGRSFNESDGADSAQVAIVNEALARAYFQNANPIGQRIRLSTRRAPLRRATDPPGGAILTIVGEVADVKQLRIIESPVQPQIFVPLDQRPEQSRGVTMVVRSQLPAAALESAIRHAVKTVDPELPVLDVITMDQVVSNAFGGKRLTTILLVIFAALALLLVVIAFYAVIAYGVAQRTQEIGVRMALGASPRSILQMILTEGAKMVVWGVALGIASALILTRFLQGMVFGLSTADPVVMLAVSALLFTVALAACWLPARRAMSVDPIVALRHD